MIDLRDPTAAPGDNGCRHSPDDIQAPHETQPQLSRILRAQPECTLGSTGLRQNLRRSRLPRNNAPERPISLHPDIKVRPGRNDPQPSNRQKKERPDTPPSLAPSGPTPPAP